MKLERNFPSVEIQGNTIVFNNENMNFKVEFKVIAVYRQTMFDTITVKGKKAYLGTILTDIVKNFITPKTLDLDLFYPNEDQSENENEGKRNILYMAWQECKGDFPLQ